ncbi:glycosyltransferase [Candidatus Kaiserbacteria bacterium]|nr:glycosyltransferase [Candidatus Kaiserbacteria bacterium]
MRVLLISTDRSIFAEESSTRRRHRAYAKYFDELHVLCISEGTPFAAVRDGNLTIYPSSPPAPFFSKLSRRIRAAYSIAGIISRYGIDVVSVQDPFETGVAALIGMMGLGATFHVQVHTDFLSPNYRRLSLINRIRALIAGFVLRRASRIRVVSEHIKASIQEQYHLNVPISALPIFADVERIHRASPDEKLLVRFAAYKTKLLVVSRLEPEKNVGLAIRAFARSAPRDVCLIIVGSGSERLSLQRFAKRLNVAERVFFDADAEAAPYFKFADLVLVPSKYEGYGLVIIEALAAGKPVLATDVGIAREAGAIVTTEEKFADALAEWFKSGPRTGELKNCPYKNFDEYVRAYCDDIKRCAIAQ